MFPSNFIAAHEIKPITEGSRYSYLGWYAQGSPNTACNEFVADPIAQPELSRVSTNVYMPNLREDFKNYMTEINLNADSPAWHLVESMHS